MIDKEAAELRRRFRQDRTAITRIYGCYINQFAEIVATFVSVLELCSIGSVHIERAEDSYTLSFVGGDVDEIMEKIVET